MENIRPIIVRSHLTKIMEKAIIVKIKQIDLKILKSGAYERGFKEGMNTGANISQTLVRIQGKRHKDSLHLFVDLTKAFDNIDRLKLFEEGLK